MCTQHSFSVLRRESTSFLWPQEVQQWSYPSAGAFLSGDSDSAALECLTHRASQSDSCRNWHRAGQETSHPLWHGWLLAGQPCCKAHRTQQVLGARVYKSTQSCRTWVSLSMEIQAARSRVALVSWSVGHQWLLPAWRVQSRLISGIPLLLLEDQFLGPARSLPQGYSECSSDGSHLYGSFLE